MMFDTHAHVNFQEYKIDYKEIIKRALNHNIWMVNVGTSYKTSQKSIAIAESYKQGVYSAVALHPIHLEPQIETFKIGNARKILKTKALVFDFSKMKKLALSSPKVVAIGESGLDWYHINSKNQLRIKKLQREVLAQHLELAGIANKPIIVHARSKSQDFDYLYEELYREILKALKKYPRLYGVLHCFAGTIDWAKKFIDLGFYISTTGIITFKNADDLRNIIKKIPIERLMAETDSPYLSPEPKRGERNEPLYVRYVIKKIADIKSISLEKVEKQLFNNSIEFFKLKY